MIKVLEGNYKYGIWQNNLGHFVFYYKKKNNEYVIDYL